MAGRGGSWQDDRATINGRSPGFSMPSPPASLAIVLAAGRGTRMESDLPKVLVPVCGQPMVRYVVEALRAAGVERIVVVVGYKAEFVQEELADVSGVEFALQGEQLGTGHAVMMCREQLAAHVGPALIIAGDQCMVQVSSVQKLFDIFQSEQPACLLGTVEREDPSGYGRIVRDAKENFVGIVEEKDATGSQRSIREVNVSTYVFDSQELLSSLDKLSNENAQSEYYLTDCPSLLLGEGKMVSAHKVLQPCESLSINSMAELHIVEEAMKNLDGTNSGCKK